MFSRTRGPKKPLFVHKTRGSKSRKSKISSHVVPSDGAVTSSHFDTVMSVYALVQKKKKKGVYAHFSGADGEKPSNRIPDYTCPHQGNKNPFSFISCTPDCKRSAPIAIIDRWIIKDNSNAPGTDEGQKASKPLKLRVPSAPIPLLKDWLMDPRGHVSRYLVSASARCFEN